MTKIAIVHYSLVRELIVYVLILLGAFFDFEFRSHHHHYVRPSLMLYVC
jgi:hypothetical protein